MGSLSGLQALVRNNEDAYIFGLWCADGYFWSSSIGLSNSDKKLIDRFTRFLMSHFAKERLKLRAYFPPGNRPSNITTAYPSALAKQVSYHTYVNSRPFVRLFQKARNEIALLSNEYVPAYFAGRFDGDGCVSKNLRNDLRISYGRKTEAEIDQKLLHSFEPYRTRIYHYRTSKTYVLYISRFDAPQFLQDIAPFSIKLQLLLSRRDSTAKDSWMDKIQNKKINP